ncbi:MAG: hypothetical protein ACK5KL_18535 [Dysgonomonas sp.]
MKTKLYLLLVVCMCAFISCSSDNDSTPVTPDPDEMIEVSFNIKDYFTSEVIDKNTKSTLQEADIKVVQYRVLEVTEGKPMSQRTFKTKNYEVTSGDLTITDKLPAGNYWIFFIGCTTDMPLPDANLTTDGDEYFNKLLMVYLPDYKSQIFSNSLRLSLSTSIEKVEESVTLQRNVGKIEVVIEDAQNMPEEVKYLYPVVKNFYPNIYRFANYSSAEPLGYQSWGTLYGAHLSGQNLAHVVQKPTGFEVGNVPRNEVIQNPQYTMTLYMLHNIDGAIFNGQDYALAGFAYTELYIYGTEQKVTASPMGDSTFPYLFEYKVVPTGINVERNKITRLTGKLFEKVTGGDNGRFNISVNNVWDGNVSNPYK